MEYAQNGNLQEFLRNNRASPNYVYENLHPMSKSLTTRDLTIFAIHIASGMDYISSKEV